LEKVVDRILALDRGERAADPLAREGLARLAQLAGQRRGALPGRRSGRGDWTRSELEETLAELAADEAAVGDLIRRLAGSRVGRSDADGRRSGDQGRESGTRVSAVAGDGGVASAVGGSVDGGIHIQGGPLAARRSAGRFARTSEVRDRPGGRAARKPPIRPRESAGDPLRGRLPDLELRVARNRDGDGLELGLVVHEPGGGRNRARREAIRLNGDPQAMVSRWFTEIERGGRGRALESALAGIGGDLRRRLLPERLGRLLWDLRHHDRTLLLRSDEPSLPWELVQLCGPSGEPGPFLCEAFSMTRWLDGSRPPPPALPLRRVGVVACRMDDPSAAMEEEADLLSLDGAARSVQRVPARYEPLVEALAAGGYDGWHFCGHGAASALDPDTAALPLDDSRRLIARDLAGDARGCGRGRPLVFLNTCHLGRGGWALTGIGGWAEQSLAAGAGAFIGASWAIDGNAAAAFASTFYTSFCNDAVPFGKAVRQAREAIRSRGDATWLAYVAYGDPRAGTEVPEPPR
jgi:hypothetical protein